MTLKGYFNVLCSHLSVEGVHEHEKVDTFSGRWLHVMGCELILRVVGAFSGRWAHFQGDGHILREVGTFSGRWSHF